jgi:hypothetical protein
MKEKILAQLKQKYAGVSSILLGLYADKIAAKVTTDDYQTNFHENKD